MYANEQLICCFGTSCSIWVACWVTMTDECVNANAASGKASMHTAECDNMLVCGWLGVLMSRSRSSRHTV